MKHLLLILLFIPFMSIGQDMTYEDLMSFENTKQIERFLIERNYERFDKDNKENIKYGYNLDLRDGEYFMNKGARISIDNDSLSFKNAFNLDLYVEFMLWNVDDYNRIYDVAKKELEFKDVLNGMAVYSSQESFVSVGFRIQDKMHYITLLRVKIEEEEEIKN